jgi:pyruvate/2-oxoglutarate dehydrogenase complex dihydrolipoamide acyltransferase (E2) component
LKKEGEEFKVGESLCEVLLMPGDLMLAVDAKTNGILGKPIAALGKTVPVKSPLVYYFLTKEDYFEYVHEQMEAEDDEQKGTAAEAMQPKKIQKADAKALMRTVKRLINEGAIKDGTGKLSDSEFLNQFVFEMHHMLYRYGKENTKSSAKCQSPTYFNL